MTEALHAVVEGSGLPLKMPVATLDELELPKKLRANAGTRDPSLLEAYAGPIVMAGRDLALIGVYMVVAIDMLASVC